MSSPADQKIPEPFTFKIAQLLFLCAIVLVPLYLGAVHLWTLSFSVILLCLSLIFFSVADLQSGRRRELRTGIETALAFYLLGYTFSVFHSKIPLIAVIETYKLASVLVVFYVTYWYCRERRQIYLLSQSMVWLGGALSFIGLLQYVGGLPNPWWHVKSFLSSVYVNHNHFAGFLEIVFPISIGLSLIEKDTSKKMLIIFLCLLMGTAFIFTLSRGGYVAVLITLLFFFALLHSKGILKRIWPVLLCAIGLLAGIAAVFGIGPVEQRFNSMSVLLAGDISSVDRFLMWKGALGVIQDHLWWGSGPGTFEFAFLKYRPEGLFGRPVFSHNDYLNLLADCGVLAFIAVILIYLMLFYKGYLILKNEKSRLKTVIASGCLASLLSLAIHSFIDFNFHIPANFMWTGVLAALLLSLQDRMPNKREKFKWLCLLVAAPAALSMIGLSLYFGLSDYFLWQARIAYAASSSDNAVAAVNKSLLLYPFSAEAYYLRGLILEDGVKKMSSIPSGANAASLKAYQDFEQAVRWNPLEPYFEYHAAKNLLHMTPDEPEKVLSIYNAVAAKDPGDPKLLYLSGKDLLRTNKSYNKQIERAALSMLNRSMTLDPLYTDKVYEEMWQYFKQHDTLDKFKEMISDDLNAITWFLAGTDQWKEHRKYYLLS